jgi:hypothetical protein
MTTFQPKVPRQVRDKSLHVFIRQERNHYRVVYQRGYPHNMVEEIELSQRFKTTAEAQSFVDGGLRAQRIYRALIHER